MMTRSIEELASGGAIIAKIHRLHLSLANKVRTDHGATEEDVAIAAVLGALDASTDYLDGDKSAGIAWLRDALDLIEAGQPTMADMIQ